MTLDHAVDLLLWGVVLLLAVLTALRSRAVLHEAAREGVIDFLRLIPRLVLGVLGAGFLAEVLPQDILVQWIGPDSGFIGVTVATAAGVVTPGGPVVGFAIAATALKSGAGAPQVIAFVTAWSLYALQRLLVWEVPVLEPKVVWVRVVTSLPLPFLAAAGAMLAGHP
jgi:uncharacterized membrane protein YraQ (UPF0718 family)